MPTFPLRTACAHLGAKVDPGCACQDRHCLKGHGVVKLADQCQTCPDYERKPLAMDAKPAAKPTDGAARLGVKRRVRPASPARRPTPPAAPAPMPAGSPTDPPVGVVLGFSRWPELIDLQLALIRETCGGVPVLVSADPDPQRPEDVPALAAVCRRHRAELIVTPERIGHTGGDMAAYGRGVTWGAGRGLAVVAKLSQRFLVTRPRWLQDGAAELLLSGLPAATRFAEPAPPPNKWGNALRTEAMLIDVNQWNRQAVLARLSPRKRWADRPGGYQAEDQIHDLIREELGGAYWPWWLVSAQRYAKADGVVWRMANVRADYDAVAARFGVRLPADFKVEGWGNEVRTGGYDVG
jgi:hypothetical protein